MPRALWLLTGLQLRGWLRHGYRSVTTVKGAVLALVGVLVLVFWFGLLLWPSPHRRGVGPGSLRAFGPPALAGYCLLNILLSGGENHLYFTPPEVGFLFPAPLSRRQLVAYKLVSTALVGLPTTLLLTAVFYPYAASLGSALAGVCLVLMFVHLFGAALQLTVAAVGAQLFRSGRRLVVGVLALGLVTAAAVARWQGGPDVLFILLAGIPETTAWKAAMQPFSWFIEVFLAPRAWPDLALAVSLGTLVNLLLLTVVFTLDTLSLESLAGSSARLYARLQRLRGRPVAGEVDEERGFLAVVPPLPRLGGIGPLLWRQLTTALRQPGRLVLAALPFGLLLVGPLLATPEESARAAGTVAALAFAVLWVSLFVTGLFPYDFRGDVDRMAALKMLPLPGWRIVLGQLAAPVLLVSCIQGIVLVVLRFLMPPLRETAATAALFVVPFNFVLFGQENLLFLLFPMRVVGANPGDFQAVGKNILMLLARGVGFGGVAVCAVGAGVVAFLLTGESVRSGVLAAWVVVVAAGTALVPLLALAFAAFDVSRDTPA